MTAKSPMDSQEKAALIMEFADDIKAQDIQLLDVRAKTSIADFFVVCTGTSDTHVRSICERVAEKLREIGIRPLRQSDNGRAGGGWVLFDYGDVVLHVMLEEKRQFYDLESFWSNLPSDPNLMFGSDAPATPENPS
ncbi:MAG: ribosome silencing factor [Fimbriimonadaceae bacterium]|nr:ribosome silencing factor [Fimbriimonadaceae bacterium]